MSTTTMPKLTLNYGEIEALREAVFGDMVDHDYNRSRPQYDRELPNLIVRIETTARYHMFYAEMLRAAEAGTIDPRLLADTEGQALVFMLRYCEEYLVRGVASYRESGLADPKPIEEILAGCRTLQTRLRAELGGA
jgi:hypothetical protein